MTELSSRERFALTFQHREPDRVPMLAAPWQSTLARWHREGLPENVDFDDYFGLDKVVAVGGDITPRYEVKVIEETDDYIVQTTPWGVTKKDWKHAGSTPQTMARTIVDRRSWEQARARMVMGPDRINWDALRQNYPRWRRQGAWIKASIAFGFDRTHSQICGTERVLLWMIEDPELVMDIINTQLDCDLQLLDMLWNHGFTFDSIFWYDDMGYRNGLFFSVDMYRRILKPIHKRAIDWAHGKGIAAHLHSCGNINELVPELVDIGLDALNPLEVKAGMDPVLLKHEYGDRLVLHGGINAMLWDDIEKTETEVKRLLPVLKEGGGYIYQEDHSVPDSVSLEDFKRIVELAKRLGSYSD